LHTLTPAGDSSAISSTIGDTILHGPHQDAQKSIKTFSLLSATSD
jgi:hypothetical protein